MTLPSSGQISISQIGQELNGSSSSMTTFNDTNARSLAQKILGAISIVDFYGKSMLWSSGLWAWGFGSYGELGLGTTTLVNISPTLVMPSLSFNWSKISCMLYHTLAIKTDGTLWAWGYDDYGQLGDGTRRISGDSIPNPIQIGTSTDWVDVLSTAHSSFAIKTDGTLWAWGYNGYGGLGLGDTTDRLVPTQVGTSNTWRKISGRHYYTLAIKTDGSLWAWGLNSVGQLGDGTVIDKYNPIQIGTSTNWAEITCITDSSFAIKTDGTLWAWGLNTSGQLGNGAILSKSNPIQIGTSTNWYTIDGGSSTNADAVLAIQNNGTLWGWGNYNSGVTTLSTLVKIPTQIGIESDWSTINISAGTHAIASKSDNTVWMWGLNSYGELDLGYFNTTVVKTPTQIPTLTNWSALHVGYHSSFVIVPKPSNFHIVQDITIPYVTNTTAYAQNISTGIPVNLTLYFVGGTGPYEVNRIGSGLDAAITITTQSGSFNDGNIFQSCGSTTLNNITLSGTITAPIKTQTLTIDVIDVDGLKAKLILTLNYVPTLHNIWTAGYQYQDAKGNYINVPATNQQSTY